MGRTLGRSTRSWFVDGAVARILVVETSQEHESHGACHEGNVSYIINIILSKSNICIYKYVYIINIYIIHIIYK